MLEPKLLRRLAVDPGSHPRGQPHLSSASGLVVVGDCAYVIADDENHIARLSTWDLTAPVPLTRFAAAALPHDAVQRKRAKADLETLIHFAATGDSPALLLALGSGSRPQRELAYVFPLDAAGEIAGNAREISTTDLGRPLQQQFGQLNLEGGFVDASCVRLLQRAHRGQPHNACISYDRAAFAAWITGQAQQPPSPTEVTLIDLGRVGGVPLGMTDATVRPGGGWMFSAVAEDTDDAYADGACVGSVLGWVDERGQVQACEALRGAPKVEGIAWADDRRLWLVTDADDPARASELLELSGPFQSPD
jgi:hypothetical protein